MTSTSGELPRGDLLTMNPRADIEWQMGARAVGLGLGITDEFGPAIHRADQPSPDRSDVADSLRASVAVDQRGNGD